jgi:ribokinase
VTGRRVVVVGDVMLDVLVQPTGPPAPTSDTPSRIRISHGGAGANLAASLASCGHDVVYVGACGDDAARQIFADALRNSGVTASLQVTGTATGVVVALVGDDAQRSMLTDRGANSLLDESFVSSQLARQFDHLHVSGYTLLDPSTRGVGVAALRRARDLGRSSSVDVCSVGPLIEVTAQVFLVAAREASMLFANEEEALALSGASDCDDALETLSRAFSEVVITRGPLGALAACGAVTAAAVTQSDVVIDTTGAGDAAAGAYLGSRLNGDPLDVSLSRAMAASAKVVRGFGAHGETPRGRPEQ